MSRQVRRIKDRCDACDGYGGTHDRKGQWKDCTICKGTGRAPAPETPSGTCGKPAMTASDLPTQTCNRERDHKGPCLRRAAPERENPKEQEK